MIDSKGAKFEGNGASDGGDDGSPLERSELSSVPLSRPVIKKKCWTLRAQSSSAMAWR